MTANRLNLMQYLWRKRGLLMCGEFAVKLGIRGDALAEIVEHDIGPLWKPAFVIDANGKRAWFNRDMLGQWQRWLRYEAPPEDLARIKEIILRNDRAQVVRNLEKFDDYEPRAFINSVLDSKY